MKATYPTAEQSSMWTVSVNDIDVGSVSDAQYRAMRRMTWRDVRLALAQMLSVGHVLLGVVKKLLIAVPLLVFWMGVALALFSPEAYTEMAHALQNADSNSIPLAVWSLLSLTVGVMFFVFGAMSAMGYHFGLRNHYSEALNRMLREHCKSPADGVVYLSRMATNAMPSQSK